jgi:hypothetical protein
MVFHAVGDTGGVKGTETQEGLAAIMVKQIEDSRANTPPTEEPLFFYHLGDVVYFNGMSTDYPVQFYEPYQNYDAPIVAIPGNHDGDTRTRTGDVPDDEATLFGFMQNFCAPSPQYLFKTPTDDDAALRLLDARDPIGNHHRPLLECGWKPGRFGNL